MNRVNEMIRNVCVMIDYENVHYNLRNDYTNVFEKDFFNRLRKYLQGKSMNVIDIIAYCNFDLPDMYNSRHQSKLHEFGIETRHTSNTGKNCADIQIAVDTMEMIFQNNLIDGVVLISDDKDMTPLIKAIKKQKGFVHLITSQNSSDLILHTPTSHSFFEDLYEIEAKNDSHLTENIYHNLNAHIKKEYVDKQKTPPLLSLQRFTENSLSWYNIFEYEFVRLLNKLELEGKIIIHKYRLKNNEGVEYGKEFEGIITDEYLYLFNSNNPINRISNCINDEFIKNVYKKYIRNI